MTMYVRKEGKRKRKERGDKGGRKRQRMSASVDAATSMT